MNTLLILFCFNRPDILNKCIQTLFADNFKFDEVLLINDGSRPEVTSKIMEYVLNTAANTPQKINLMNFGKNQGYSYAAEFAFNYAKLKNPNYLFFIEQDYIFRRGWAEEALAVLDAAPNTVALSGYSNPDFYDKSKTEEMFPRIIKEDFNEDPCDRASMHKPFELETSLGKIQVQGTSNSCGTCVINWRNLMQLNSVESSFWEKVIDRACNKQPGGNRSNYGDGPFSHGISYFWYKTNKYSSPMDFPWLDICDYSLSNHVCGGAESINGKIVPEGYTFVGSPKWKDDYMLTNPRI